MQGSVLPRGVGLWKPHISPYIFPHLSLQIFSPSPHAVLFLCVLCVLWFFSTLAVLRVALFGVFGVFCGFLSPHTV